MSVDLPAPFSPHKAWISPGCSANSTLRRAKMPEKRLVTPRSVRTGSATTHSLQALEDGGFSVEAIGNDRFSEVALVHGDDLDEDRRDLGAVNCY